MILNEKQQKCIELAQSGRNLFITGSGGVGKSVVINKIKNLTYRSSVVLAPTGIAALNVGGSTLHRTFGLPFSIAHMSDWSDINQFTDNLFSQDTIKTIIIDEISMVRADYFVCMDRKLRKIRRTNKAFGGLQVIVVGDFFQLPPVLMPRDEDVFYDLFESIFCFETETWKDCEFEVVHLDQVMRQDDELTIRALNAIRRGKRSSSILKWINQQCEKNDISDDAITLCTTNSDAYSINMSFYEELEGEERRFYSKVSGTFGDKEKPVDDTISLKLGCKVVICANNSSGGYKNGQTGVVVGFNQDNSIDVLLDHINETVSVSTHIWESFAYKVSGGQLIKNVIGTFEQLPIKLGYGITIHKSQGMTLDECIIDLGSGSFTHGQTYVALSRIRSIEKLGLDREIRKSDIIVYDEVCEFYQSLGI